VAAIDLRHVEKAGRVADQRATREIETRNRLKAPFVERARAIRDAPAALEGRADRRMRLEPLKLLKRVQIRVAVVEPDDKADRDLMIFEVIKKRAAIRAPIERPPDRVHDTPGLVPLRRDFP